jgi:hypothetical protein
VKDHNLDVADFEMDEIVSIEFFGDVETVDISVEDVHMFFANDIYSHNSSLEDEVIEGAKVSESYNKIMIADFVMSLSRKLNDKIGGTGRWHIIKNRFGPDGMTFPSKINTMTGHIEIFEPNSDIGKSVSQSMTGEGMVKKALSQKFKELEGF